MKFIVKDNIAPLWNSCKVEKKSFLRYIITITAFLRKRVLFLKKGLKGTGMEQVIGGGDNSRPPSCTEKVAFSIFRYFPYGGLQLDMMRMAREFTARGIQVDIYCMGYDAPEIPDGVVFKVLKTSGLSNQIGRAHV